MYTSVCIIHDTRLSVGICTRDARTRPIFVFCGFVRPWYIIDTRVTYDKLAYALIIIIIIITTTTIHCAQHGIGCLAAENPPLTLTCTSSPKTQRLCRYAPSLYDHGKSHYYNTAHRGLIITIHCAVTRAVYSWTRTTPTTWENNKSPDQLRWQYDFEDNKSRPSDGDGLNWISRVHNMYLLYVRPAPFHPLRLYAVGRVNSRVYFTLACTTQQGAVSFPFDGGSSAYWLWTHRGCILWFSWNRYDDLSSLLRAHYEPRKRWKPNDFLG